MTYRDFTLEKLQSDFGIKNRRIKLFDNIPAILPSDVLSISLGRNKKMPLRNEKSRSEWIVAPILAELKELNDDFFTVYSGDLLNVDKPRGLAGECDFMIAKNYNSYTLEAPILAVVEAKKENFDLGTSQCAAQLIASRIFNKERNAETNILYGCVTTADAWLFLKLEDEILYIDTEFYYLNDLPQLLGVFQYVLNFYKDVI